MSELSGTEAFEHIVSTLLDLAADRTRDNDKRREAESERNDAVRDLANVRQELGLAKTDLAKYRGADEAFINLYSSIDATLRLLDQKPNTAELAKSLRDNMAACKKIIDPIPF